MWTECCADTAEEVACLLAGGGSTGAGVTYRWPAALPLWDVFTDLDYYNSIHTSTPPESFNFILLILFL